MASGEQQRPKVVFVERRGSHSVSIERLFRQIVRELGDRDFDIEFQNVPYANGLTAILKNLLFFRPRAADVYHITGDIHYMALRLPGERTLLTIHDLVALHRRSGPRRQLIKKLFFDWPLRKVRYVSTVSQASAEEIAELSGIRPRVIEPPLFDGFHPEPERPFDQQSPIILHIGSAENKNLAALIEAVVGFRCRLRIIGRLTNEQAAALDRAGISYGNAFGLDDSQMVEEYRNADILYFCSTYEGFGLPIIEAQAMRKPVVTSDLEPMRSVAGGGAALADPFDPQSIRAALERITTNADYRAGLVRKGQWNIARFDSGRSAAAYASIYREIVGANSHTI